MMADERIHFWCCPDCGTAELISSTTRFCPGCRRMINFVACDHEWGMFDICRKCGEVKP